MGKPPSKLMSSHVYKLMQLVEAQPRIASFSFENESLTIQISALADKAKKDKDCLNTLEKDIDTEKAFRN
nr:hypothetical protein CFP56_45928 [Quercus suber]